MALAMCSMKIISRRSGSGKERSAVAASAYRSSTKVWNERDGCYNDYTRKKGVVHSEILLPPGAPPWMYDRPKLWNGAEGVEVRHDARLAKDVVLALPNELTQKQNIELARDFAKTLVAQGIIVDLSVHDKGDGNPHAHVMIATRGVDGDGFSKKKNREWDSKDFLIKCRKEYERLTNEYLERYGHKERIDVRSYAEQGIDRMPTLHLGAAAHQMEKKGIMTRLGDRNREIEEQNKKLEEINRQIDACQKEAEQVRDEVAQKGKQGQEEIEKHGAEAQEHFRPEPASTKYDRLLEHYARAAQETTEALQYRLTEKGIQDFVGQEKNVEDVREPLPQQMPELETPFHHTRVEESEQERQKYQDYDALYDVAKQIEHYRRAEQAVQDFVGQEKNVGDVREPSPQQTPEPETPFHHTRVEESERKRQRQQDYDALYDAAKQKRKEHRLVRDTERQNRRYQNTYKQAEEREKKVHRIEQTTHHGWPETPKPERQPDFQEKYKIAERRHHGLEKHERRYSRSRDDPEHEK